MVYTNLSELPDKFKESITEAVEIILSYKIENLKQVILFGSCARLDISARSDIDIAIVLKYLKSKGIRGGL